MGRTATMVLIAYRVNDGHGITYTVYFENKELLDNFDFIAEFGEDCTTEYWKEAAQINIVAQGITKIAEGIYQAY